MLIKVICLFRSLFPIRFVAHMVLFSILGLFSLFSKAMASKSANEERTFLMVKPDGVQRGLIGDIIKRFEQKGFKMVACKFQQVSLYIANSLHWFPLNIHALPEWIVIATCNMYAG